MKNMLNKPNLTITVVIVLLAIATLTMQQSAQGAVAASDVAVSLGAGAVAANGDSVQDLVEGDKAEDWKLYSKAKAVQHAKWCVKDLRELIDITDCTMYYCDDVGELLVVCSVKHDDSEVVFTFVNSSGCFPWERASRLVTDSQRNIRGCTYVDTL